MKEVTQATQALTLLVVLVVEAQQAPILLLVLRIQAQAVAVVLIKEQAAQVVQELLLLDTR